MFALTASQRFFLYGQAVDMRKSFDALSGIVTTDMGKDVLSGDVYIFIGKSRDKIKLLVGPQIKLWLRSGKKQALFYTISVWKQALFICMRPDSVVYLTAGSQPALDLGSVVFIDRRRGGGGQTSA